MPNNSKTTWQFPACRTSNFQPTTCISSSSEIESENEVAFVKKTVGSINKTSVLANLTSTDFDIINDPNGWLDCSIIQQAQVLLQQHNPLFDGLQRPTLGRVRNFDIASGEFIQIKFFIQAPITGYVLVLEGALLELYIYLTAFIMMLF